MINYVEKINSYTIGGNIADGQWVYKYLELYVGKPQNNQIIGVYDLSTYLPNSNYQYEILLRGYVYTSTSNHSYRDIRVSSGAKSYSDADTTGIVITTQNTQTSDFRESSGSAIIPILQDDQNLTLYFKGSGNGSGSSSAHTCKLQLLGYRRIGTNNSANSNLVEKINIPNKELTIGGNIFNGQWVNVLGSNNICNMNYEANKNGVTYTYDLKKGLNLLPNDNYAYELIVSGWANTSASRDTYVQLIVTTSKITPHGVYITAQNTKTTNTKSNAHRTTIVPIAANGILNIVVASDKAGNFGLELKGYRRIGTNT